MVSVLFVCTGNICRSPTAEGIFAHLMDQRGLRERFQVDSAGMIDYHVGEAPDHRMRRVAAARGVPIDDLRARQIHPRDGERFDYVLAMDRGHRTQLLQALPEAQDRVHLFLSYLNEAGLEDVPDPYYGPIAGFENTFDLIERGTHALLDHLEAKHGAG
jgi:protein-tyrosine phosphatase